MASNAIIRQRIDEIQAQAKVDREWWDKKRANIQSEFMKELDGGAPASRSTSTSRPATSGGEKIGSDEDTVLVEGGGPTSPAPPTATGGTKGSSKKKKGKK